MIILVIVLVGLLVIGVPIAFALGGGTIAAFYIDGSIPMTIIPQRLFASISMNVLLAIPFFILAGNLMAQGGMSRRIVNFAMACIGRRTGGLALVTIVAVMFFSALSGSSSATAAAIGIIMIPEMLRYRYDRSFAAATVASSAELGTVIPPSATMIIYGVSAGASVGTMFIAGLLPGIMIGVSLMVVAYVRCRMHGFRGVPEDVELPGRWKAFKSAFLALLMPVIILGGIYGGVFSPTEAACVAVWYGLIIGMFAYKELKPKHLFKILVDSARASTVVMLIVANASLFAWYLTRYQIPNKIAMWISEITESPIIFLLLVNLLLFVVGMFFEASPAIIILAPILAPIATSFGIDPIHFGIIMIVNLAVGMVTPPVGLNLYITCNIAELSIEKLTKSILPYLIVLIIDVFIISYVPSISLLLPRLIGV